MAEPNTPPPDACPPPLVGRDRELATLREHLAEALAGRGGLVLLAGEAGIGKTSLAEALGREAEARGALALAGRCYDLTETPPYGPWLELLARYRARAADPRPPDGPREPDAGAPAGQAALFAQLGGLLISAARRQPLLLLLDDLHWADPASLDLLRVVARRLAELPLLLLATYRPEAVARPHPLYALLPSLVRESRAARLELQPLGTADLRALVGARYALPAGAGERLVGYLEGRAEGNPFFVEELLRALEAEGVLRRAGLSEPDGAGAAWALGDLGGGRLPALLRQVLDRRLDQLGETERGLLAVAAVLGQEVPLDLWAAVALLEEEALLDVVERGAEARVLVATEDGLGLRFAHALVREALYEGLLAPRRRIWHRRAAEVLLAGPTPRVPSGRGSPDPDAVAEHFRRAGDPRAVEWLVRAGERAQRTWALTSAAQRLEAAVALLAAREELARERGWLLYRLGLLRFLAEPQRALAALGDASQAATDAGDAALAAHALYFRGMTLCCELVIRRGLADLEAGVAALEALPDRGPVVLEDLGGFVAAPSTYDEYNPRGALVNWLASAGRFAEARALGEANVAGAPGPAAGAMARGAYGDAYLGLGVAYAAQGRPDEARRAFERAREAYGAIGNDYQVALTQWAELRVVLLPYETERVAERRRLADEAERATARASEVVDPRLSRRMSRLRRQQLLLLEGEWGEIGRPEAERDEFGPLAPAVQVGEQGVAFVAHAVAELAREQGEPDRAWALVRGHLPEGPATAPGDSLFLQTLALQRVAAALALDAGDLPTARTWLETHDRWLDWSGAVLGRSEAALGWAAYHRAAGDTAPARDHAARALALAAEPRQPLALLAAHRLAGELATAAGDLAAAGQHLEAALALAEDCAAPYERALTLLALAALRRAAGDRAAAEPLLAEARAICEPLGARRALALADALLPGRVPRPPGGYPGGLTAREVEVLVLIARGRSNREIADALSLSVRTVDRHVDNLYRKLDVRGRGDAAAFAARHGLLPG